MLRKFTYLAALAFLLVGVIGFFPLGKTILGPITTSHNLLHLGTGLVALCSAYQKPTLMATFFNIFSCLYFAVAILGHVFNGNIFNLLIVQAPLDNYLHLAIAISLFVVVTIITRLFSKKELIDNNE
jgi:Domain of unknown function (DUF4383)